MYTIQVTSDPTFNIIHKSDPITDTAITFSDFSEGTKYYWRVQVKDNVGSLGPWSNRFNFIVFIPLPSVP